jgi:hypothetical protein
MIHSRHLPEDTLVGVALGFRPVRTLMFCMRVQLGTAPRDRLCCCGLPGGGPSDVAIDVEAFWPKICEMDIYLMI